MCYIEVELQNFIKKTILTLACCNNIDHRNYDRKKKFYRLKELAINNSIDNSIVIIVKEILDGDILKDGIDDDKEDDSDSDEDEDEIYEKNNSKFNNFIDYVGLYEMYNLHTDNCDNFKDEFVKIIKKHNK